MRPVFIYENDDDVKFDKRKRAPSEEEAAVLNEALFSLTETFSRLAQAIEGLPDADKEKSS
jgi:hypothetical protein